MTKIPCFVLLLLIFCVPASAQDRVDYLRAVKPILSARCYSCHGALKQKNHLRLDTVVLMKKGGDSGTAIVPGESSKSLLVAHVTAAQGMARMPPESEGEPLKLSEISLILAWIDQGASGPASEKQEADPADHWAFKAPARPAVPKSAKPNPIDAFIAAERDKHGLKPQPPADKRQLLRRVYLDLIGLPPTRDEQKAFVADQSPDAFEKVVDRLLASKQYGERWGRHWMDIWRYSDPWGLGAEIRNSQRHIWHWRDWIIESLNADKGYDQMLREMLAADELYPADAGRLRAGGFLARQYFIFNRNTWLEEVVEHTSKAFLGLTMNCSKCHDHKYDPIAQRDFYRMRAFFEPYQVRTDMTAGEADFTKDGIPRPFDCNLEAPTYLFVRGDEKQPNKDKAIAPGLPAILAFAPLTISPVALPPDAFAPGSRSLVLENHLRLADKQIAGARETLDQARKALTLAEAKSKNKEAKSSAKSGTPIARDDFAQEKSNLWETRAGSWKYEAGRLKQNQDGANRAILRLKSKSPGDFQARVNFAVTGGQTWKSAGLSFDVDGPNEVCIYLSAYAGGPKLQISYRQADNNYAYPADGMQARAVKLNEAQELTIQVRGSLINVAVNGEHALAYRLPAPRRSGSIDLITYDAKAEFTAFELEELAENVALRDAGKPGAQAPALTVEQARLGVAIADKALAAAMLQPEALKARWSADGAALSVPPAADAKERARVAARAERQLTVAMAEEALARAEATLAGTKKADDQKKLVSAREALAKARKELEAPGENYTPLRGALKTPESNLEQEASRNKPFPRTSSGRRSALAAWMTDARNPLTARVAVNHMWARHFGTPLVATVFDFGRKGAAPTHSELLDWLAVELRESGWSMKKLHRLMVTSETYRMSSSAKALDSTDNRVATDPANRYYWRMNPVRMEAQIVRDALLHLSGELDLTMGGPPVPVADESSRRRSLYFLHSHNDQQKFLEIFDDANVLECYRRAESIVPQQALALQNSKMALMAAEKIARRLNEKDEAAFIRAGFELVLGSSPSSAEIEECKEALKELMKIAGDPLRARVNFIQALLNHNDFITIR